MAGQLKNITVIGAGVIGLTTAVKIQERGGYKVTVIAETLPSDPKTIRFTSHWAGAHHSSNPGGNALQQRVERETFEVLWELSSPRGAAEGCLMRTPQEEYYGEVISQHPMEHAPDFRHISTTALPPNTVFGVGFTTVTIDTPVYLYYLLTRFLASGGTVVRAAVQHINQIIEGGGGIFCGQRAQPPDAIIVCAGLGARFLGGVEDKTMYPVRGQTVLLKAPWVTISRAAASSDGLSTYIIPRRSGDVIVGGTRESNDWYPIARAATTAAILQRGLALSPELAPPEVRALRTPTVEDLVAIQVEVGCGLRPAREGGIRLEVEWAEVKGLGLKVPVVHNYGHGGTGFQSSWGSASVALELLEGALKSG